MPPATVNIGGSAVQLVAGTNHACVLLSTDKVRCWGWGRYGRLGSGNTQNIGDAPFLPPPDVQLGDQVLLLSAHLSGHTCTLFTLGSQVKLRCWGRNNEGQLGLGHTETLGDEPGELPDLIAPALL